MSNKSIVLKSLRKFLRYFGGLEGIVSYILVIKTKGLMQKSLKEISIIDTIPCKPFGYSIFKVISLCKYILFFNFSVTIESQFFFDLQ